MIQVGWPEISGLTNQMTTVEALTQKHNYEYTGRKRITAYQLKIC